jgi:hypothetical protein
VLFNLVKPLGAHTLVVIQLSLQTVVLVPYLAPNSRRVSALFLALLLQYLP